MFFDEVPETHRHRKPGVTGNRFMDISILVQQVLDKNKISPDMNFQTLSERFEEVVGALVLPHVKLVKIEKRTLVLKAANSTWKSELFLQKNAIIDRCNTILGKPFIQALRFV